MNLVEQDDASPDEALLCAIPCFKLNDSQCGRVFSLVYSLCLIA
jgi:hypothetical protein